MKEDANYFEMRDVWTRLDGREILKGVGFGVPAGKTTVVLGGSGAGKSVLLKHLIGLLRPDSGSVLVEGQDIVAVPERRLASLRRRVGVLFQDGALFDSLSVGRNVAFPIVESGARGRRETREAVAEALGKVGLEGEEEKMPASLSGGMRKRVALARAMIMDPSCLLCDEPTAGLDPILSETITELIRETVRGRRITAVVVTHDLAVMRALADHVVFLDRGTVRFSGTPDELESAEDSHLRRFLESGFGGG